MGLIENYKEKRDKILAMAAPEAIEKRHKNGQMTARERLDYLFDEGTFTEIGLYVKHRTTAFGLDKKVIPAEGVVTGYGKVNGRYVVAFAEDFMALAGTFGEYHGKKEVRAIELAMERGWPVIGMNDSGGARLQEGMDTLEAYGWLFRAQIKASGIVPQIALLMGPCLGGQAYHPIMQDFLIQCKETGFMGIAGPAFVKTQTGEDISLPDLCGYKAHAVKAGQSHLVADGDKDAIDKAKKLLSYFPDNNKAPVPVVETKDAAEKKIAELNEIVPESPLKAYDMKKVIKLLVDDGDFMELLPLHARNVIIGFSRFNGRSVGICANQPMWASGCIDINAADKMARFIRFCDLFSIPVLALQDCPGYLIGSGQDHAGILRHGAKLLFAYADATVPLISIMLRKSYAGAHYGMLDKSIGADFVWAWPGARVTIVGAETAASIIFAKEIKNAEDPKAKAAERIKEYSDLYENPYHAAERGFIDDVIMPEDTRTYINRSLDILKGKNWDSEPRIWRKYSNINL
mgnify:CR=1 FL=1